MTRQSTPTAKPFKKRKLLDTVDERTGERFVVWLDVKEPTAYDLVQREWAAQKLLRMMEDELHDNTAQDGRTTPAGQAK